MNQIELEIFKEGALPNGEKIFQNEIVMCEYGSSTSFHKVILFEGEMCLDDHFMFGKNMPIVKFLKTGSFYSIKKSSWVDVYRFCKKHNWDFKFYVNKFRPPLSK